MRLVMPSVLQSLARSSDSLGVCATRGTNSISDSLLGIEAADVALLVVRVLAAAIPSEDYWRFSDVVGDGRPALLFGTRPFSVDEASSRLVSTRKSSKRGAPRTSTDRRDLSLVRPRRL